MLQQLSVLLQLGYLVIIDAFELIKMGVYLAALLNKSGVFPLQFLPIALPLLLL
ncbi:hypothetical protein ACWAU3_05540 [Shewanella sp. JL219SE-S6]